ncbi:MAG: serine/threonine-protein kinase [Bacteroidota bacterium]
MDPMIGRTIDSYKILEVLGRGGMGVVYKAVDTTLDRDVAIKMMDVLIATDPNFLKRFQSEAKALAKLQNPNIVSIFALRQTEFGICIVMEFVKGKTLADVLKQSVLLPIPRVIHIFKQLLTALDHAHKGGVIHRDIKPGNVMLAEGDVVKVTDFGLAKIQRGAVSTVTMGTAGTLYYMSPEQIRGLGQVDHRGDIYSAGMALYECLTGRVPFNADDSDFAVAQMIVEGKIPPPDKLNPSLPKELVKIVLKSIDKDPARRYQAAAEMVAALAQFGASMKPGQYKLAEAPTIVSSVASEPVVAHPARKPVPVRLYATIGAAAVVLLVTYFLVRPLVFPDEGLLTIRTNPPGGRIYVDNVLAEKSPVVNYGVDPGARRLTAVWGQSRFDTTVTVERGKAVNVLLALRKPAEQPKSSIDPGTASSSPPTENVSVPETKEVAMGTLVLEAVPFGEVKVDDGDYRSAEGGIRVPVPPGSRTVTFKGRSGMTKETRLHVGAGETNGAKCYFSGEIRVVTTLTDGKSFAWASIAVDGVPQDKTTPATLQLPSGRYKIGVSRQGFDAIPKEQIVTLEPSFDGPRKVPVSFKLRAH